MRKLVLFIFLSFALVGCNLGYETTTTEAVVIDTENYLEIDSVSDLKNMEMNKSYVLMTDLDLSQEEWNPIGSFIDPFLGNFNGNNHTISNLTIDEYTSDFNGLFGYVKGDIFDLEVVDFSINYQTRYLSYAGGLAGVTTGDIANVTVSGTINVDNTKSNTFAGLLVGFSQAELDNITDIQDFQPNIISDSTATGSISVDSLTFAFVGGLVGKTYNTTVYDSSVDVILDVKTEEQRAYVGGLIGHNYGGILVGFESEREETNIDIYRNLAISDIFVESLVGNIHVGGLIGYNNYGTAYENFSDTNLETVGLLISIGLLIGEDWQGDVANNLAIGDVLVNQPVTLVLDGPVVGASYTPIMIENNYFYSDDFSSSETEGLITSANLNDNTFYLDTLGWEQAFASLVIDYIE